jgi:hypothetical protein
MATRIMMALTLVGASLPTSALANPYDISLRGLGRPASADAGMSDAAVQRYRALTGELALAMSPKPLQPAETLGMSGFEFSLAETLTDISQNADYWQGQAGAPILEGVQNDWKVPNALQTPTLHLRKGLPLSSELGIQATYLARSEMFMLGAEMKFALHDTFARYFPSLAGRLAFGRLFGSPDLDILTAEADGMMSIPFGIGGMAQVTPYVGGGVLFAHVNSYVIDETPYAVTDPLGDQKGGADGSLYNFPTLEWQDNRFPRYFGGVRLKIAMIEVLYEFNLGIMKFKDIDKQLTSHSFKLGFDV